VLSHEERSAQKSEELAVMRRVRNATHQGGDAPIEGDWVGPVRLGDNAPDFVQKSTEGTIRFHEWMGDSWIVLFAHPGDFTPVCTTELGMVARLKSEFDRRNVKALGLSVDPMFRHEIWACDIAETQGIELNFPLLADTDRKVARLYDMIHPNAHATETVRSTFIIDPNKIVRFVHSYPASTGRNFDEILRIIDSLQLADTHRVATPGNWSQGDNVLIPASIPNPEADRLFPRGYAELKPYLRVTPQPNLKSAPPNEWLSLKLDKSSTEELLREVLSRSAGNRAALNHIRLTTLRAILDDGDQKETQPDH